MKICPKEELLQIYLDNELAGTDEAAVRAHLATCSPCAAKVKEMEQTLALLGDAFIAELPETVPTARLRARIEAAVAEKAAPRFMWAQLFWRFGWAAALLLLAAGIVGWAWLGTDSINQPLEAHYEKPVPAVTPESQPPTIPTPERKSEVAQQLLPRQRVRHDSTIKRAGNKDEGAEIVTQFFPLREGEDMTALAGKQVLRVELSGSALSETIFPVGFETTRTSVIADVVLGQDGLARAIRFVR